MVIIITGASHTGKTLLAQRLLEKYKYPYLSLDHLKMGLIRSSKTNLTPEDDEALTDELWPIVREMVKTAIENQQNLIVEGCYIPSMSDAYIEAHIDEIRNHASAIEKRLCDTDYTIESLKFDNHYYMDAFTRSGEQVTMIDTDFWQTVEELVEQ